MRICHVKSHVLTMYANNREGLPVSVCGARKGRVYKSRLSCVTSCFSGLFYQHHHSVLGVSIWPKIDLRNLGVHGCASCHWQCNVVWHIGGDRSPLSLLILVSPCTVCRWWTHSAHIPPLGINGFWFTAAAHSHLCEMQVLEPVEYNPGFYTLLKGLWGHLSWTNDMAQSCFFKN